MPPQFWRETAVGKFCTVRVGIDELLRIRIVQLGVFRMNPFAKIHSVSVFAIEVEKIVHFSRFGDGKMSVSPGELIALSVIQGLTAFKIFVKRARQARSIGTSLTVY